MTSINEVSKLIQELNIEPSPNKDHELLGINEALTRLWIASWKDDKDEIGKRIANLLIAALVNAERLGVKDVDFYFAKRIEELRNELKNNPIHEDDKITKVNSIHPIKLENTKYYGPDSREANIIRDYIGDEFGGKRNQWDLQCTEYAYYRLSCAGVKIEWIKKHGRHGGLWPNVISGKYKILDAPVEGGVICLPLNIIPVTGHIAYVEKINPDDSINISEANWGTSGKDIGRYWERVLPVEKWRDKYHAKFIDFT